MICRPMLVTINFSHYTHHSLTVHCHCPKNSSYVIRVYCRTTRGSHLKSRVHDAHAISNHCDKRNIKHLYARQVCRQFPGAIESQDDQIGSVKIPHLQSNQQSKEHDDAVFRHVRRNSLKPFTFFLMKFPRFTLS